MTTWQTISTVLAAIGFPVFLGALATAWFTRKKVTAQIKKLNLEAEELSGDLEKGKASAIKILTESATAMVGPLKTELEETRRKLEDANQKISTLNERIDETVAKLDDANAREEAQRSRAEAAEARARVLERQLQTLRRPAPKNPRETD